MTLSGRRAFILLGILGLSLCVNLFAAGILFGRWSAGRHEGERALPIVLGDERFLRRAPPEAQPYLREALRERRGEIIRGTIATRDARRRVVEALAADPFDARAVDAAFADVRRSTADTQAILHEQIGQALARMPQAVRVESARAFSQQRERRGDDDRSGGDEEHRRR